MSIGDIQFNEIDQSQIVESRGAIMAFVGPAQKGPIGTSRLLNNESDLFRLYGKEYSEDAVISTVRQALRGGAQIRFSRSVHYTDISDPLTKTSLPSEFVIKGPAVDPTGAEQTTSTTAAVLQDGDILNVDVDGAVTPVTFLGVAAESVAATPETWDLSGGRVLTLIFDQGLEQSVSVVDGDFVDPANVTAAELAAAFNDGRMFGGAMVVVGGTAVKLVSDTKGSDSYVQVTGGTLNVELNFSTTEQASVGPNNVGDLNSVSASDLHSILVAAAIPGLTLSLDSGTLTMTTVATGSGVYLGFSGDAGIPEKFGFVDGVPGRNFGTDAGAAVDAVRVFAKEDGTWADGTSVVVTVNADDSAKLDVVITPPIATQDGNAPETFLGIDKDSYPTTSALWGFEKINDVNPDVGSFLLDGGDNGISGMTPATRVGSVAALSGIYGLDELDYIDLFIPYMTDNTQQIGVKNWAEATGVHYVPSIPVGLEPQEALDFARAEGSYSGGTRIRSSYVSWQYGDLTYIDELAGDGSTTANYDNAGGLATVYAFNDVREGQNGNFPGPWLAPSGRDRGVVAQDRIFRPLGVSFDMSQQAYASQRSAMRSSGVNFFEVFGGEVLVKGNRTTHPESTKLLFLNVRRLLLAIRRSLTPIMLDLSDEPHGPPLWRTAWQRVTEMLQRDYAEPGAFQPGANDPGFIYLSDQNARNFSEAILNTPSYVDAGIFRSRLAVKPITAVESIVVDITVDSASVEYDEQI